MKISIRFSVLFLLLVLSIVFTKSVYAQSGSCASQQFGDIDCNGVVQLTDLSILLSNFGKFLSGATATPTRTPTRTPTTVVNPTATRTPTPAANPTNTPTSGPIPTPGASGGIWISSAEIAKLPTSGSAWNNVLSAANSSWGEADLSNNDSDHDVKTLAGALVAVRLNDNQMRQKTIQGLQSATRSRLARALELGRGLQTYIIAADIIGYRDPAFVDWVGKMVTANVQGHSGGTGIIGTAKRSATNWGGHARASMAAAAVYLNHSQWKSEVVTAYKAFIGVPAPGNEMSYTSTSWHAGSPKAGVNAPNATKSGVNLSGVLPEDWRRGGEFKWLPSISGYMWGGMQGYVVTAVILHRANLVPFDSGTSAVVRSTDMLYGTGHAASNNPVFRNPASGDDVWVPWVVNYYTGKNYGTSPVDNPGKNMGWTDWTHAR